MPLRDYLFELEDSSYCPRFIRDALTDHLRFAGALFKSYRHALPLLRTLIEHSPSNQVVDLCSGAGGPWHYLSSQLVREYPDLCITLTDRFPNQALWTKELGPQLRHYPYPVDAKSPPNPKLQGARTLFTSYHHFSTSDARDLLRSAQASRTPLGVFELTGRKPIHFVMVFVVFLLSFVSAALLRPYSASRICFTYIVPLIPLAILFDGLISNLRSFSALQLKQLTVDLADPQAHYRWISGSLITTLGLPMTYLIGIPE